MKYLLIGNPIEHSISPQIHNYFFEKMGHTSKIYEKLLVENLCKNTVDEFYKQNIMGLNVTIPHKENIINCIYDTDNVAKKIGSVNTLKHTKKGYIGYNTDILGINYTFLENNIDITNKNILIIGAGGSGRTASFSMLGASSITIANRTIQRANTLKNNLECYANIPINAISIDDIKNLQNINIIINTSTIGFLDSNDDCIIDSGFLENNNVNFVLDIIYTPAETKLLNIAKKNNVGCVNGLSMLIYQAICADEIWIDEKLTDEKRKNMKNEIEEMLIQNKLV